MWRSRCPRARSTSTPSRSTPKLQQIGADLHPDHPYQDPRVSVHINDGRAFLEQTDTKYDLILFALPDSLTLVSGPVIAAAGELPVHAAGDGVGA